MNAKTYFFTADQISLLALVFEQADREDIPLYLVGGVLRDLFLGQPCVDKDIDLLVEGDAIELAQLVSEDMGGQVKLFTDFLTAKIVRPKMYPSIEDVDFATARVEEYLRPGLLPQVQAASVEDDLRRRDFSINALALPVSGLVTWIENGGQDPEELHPHVLDFFSGLDDLKHRIVKILHDRSFVDDPTRIFRACRYVVRINGTMTTRTEELLHEAVENDCLETISQFRKLTELKKIFVERDFQTVFSVLGELGVLENIQLVQKERQKEVEDSLDRLARMNVKTNADNLFQIGLALFMYFLPADERRPILKRYGFSKKKSDLMLVEIEAALQQKMDGKTPDSALILQLAASGKGASNGAIHTEAVRRGLV